MEIREKIAFLKNIIRYESTEDSKEIQKEIEYLEKTLNENLPL